MGQYTISSTGTAMCAKPAALGVTLEQLALRYQDSDTATLSGFDMHIPASQWTCILGRSGCGKSTLLRYLAGLLHAQAAVSGKLTVSDGQSLEGRIAYMAQQDLLMPWLSVLDNVCLSRRFGQAAPADTARAVSLLRSVGLAEYQQAMPQQLSGGMRQRVALARTLMQDQPVVLMDEPFSALDAVTRHKLQTLAATLLRGKTVVLITHDPLEAIRLAHQLYILQGMPAQAESLALPASRPPRSLDADGAQLQQQIIEALERDYA